MKTIGSAIGIFICFILFIVVLGGIGFAVKGYDYSMFKFWEPKYENARREVFENTKSFKSGNIQDLQNLQIQYSTADADGKDIIAHVVLQRAANMDENKLPIDLQNWISKLRNNITTGAVQ